MHEARICAIKYSLDESIFPQDSALAGEADRTIAARIEYCAGARVAPKRDRRIIKNDGLPAGKSDSLNFYQRSKMQLRRDGNDSCRTMLTKHVGINPINFWPVFNIGDVYCDADNAIKARVSGT